MSGDAPAPPVAMTEAAAAAIVAKQRRGAPGVEQNGIHDAAPTPHAKAPDFKDEGGKSLGNTSRNNHVEHDVEDDGPRPFDSEEFGDGGVGKKMMTRGGDDSNDTQIIEEEKEEEEEEIENNEERDDAQDANEEVEVNEGRPRNQAVMLPTRSPPRSMLPNDNGEESMLELEATLVPNEPVYDGVPLEPVPPWYTQEKARQFLAFVCIMFVAAVVVISVLLSRSSIPEDLSPSTEIVTVVLLTSTAPSTSLSNIPSMSFAPSTPPSISFTPSTPPSKTSHPSNLPSSSFLPSSSPTNTCFDKNDTYELKTAVRAYIDQDCAQNENCDTARLYGYPMNSWCVGQITDMSYLFNIMPSFNEDISESNVSSVTDMVGMFASASAFNGDLSALDVSSVTDMYEMFYDATAFNKDLCAWSDKFPCNSANVIFSESGCAFRDDPNEQQGGPFCASSCSE